MRGLEKNYMKRGHINIYIYTHIDGHRDSMKESAKGRFFENNVAKVKDILNPEGLKNYIIAQYLT